MFESLFGSEMPLAARFFIAFLVVLALIGVTAWLVRRFGANRLGSTARGRQPRLAVIDAATVDGRRRLVLIRRDNIEHLLMIGGPTDLVVEPNIVRAVAAREVAREPARTGAPAEPAARPSPAVENGWPLQPAGEPAPTHPPRSYRPAATDEPWIAPEPTARPRPADITGIANELSNRLNNPDTPPVVRNEPPPRPPAPLSEPASAQADHNLAEMAQQLEAALRRSPAPEGRPPVTDPFAGHLPGAPLKGSDTGARVPLRDHKPRVEPKAEPKFEPRSEPKFDSKPEPREPAATPGKNLYENLEEEMASLLGRPPGKS
jgi:flagellar protein FliO/FliZ